MLMIVIWNFLMMIVKKILAKINKKVIHSSKVSNSKVQKKKIVKVTSKVKVFNHIKIHLRKGHIQIINL